MRYYEINDKGVREGIPLSMGLVVLGDGAGRKIIPLPEDAQPTFKGGRLIATPENENGVTVFISYQNEGNYVLRGQYHLIASGICSGEDPLKICDAEDSLIGLLPDQTVCICRSDQIKGRTFFRNISGNLLEVACQS